MKNKLNFSLSLINQSGRISNKNMKKATKIPSGCIEILVEKSPLDKAPTDLDIPHAGQGTPVKSLKGHKVGSEVKLLVPR